MLYRGLDIVLIIPCFNEEMAISKVIREFRFHFPALRIYVFDNHSTDQTADIASAEGATVIHVPLRGKGNVVRRMFADIEADVYVMVDGDATYHAPSIKELVDKLLNEHLDMVVGCRQTPQELAATAYRKGHQLGNQMLTQSVVQIFGGSFTDMLSGYRAFTRRYVKSFPALSHGFEIETELTVHALELRMPYGEIMTPYAARPEGSVSKLSTYRDGWKILKTIGRLYVSERPLMFFTMAACLLTLISILLAIPIGITYLQTELVPRLPTAVLSASIMVCAILSFSCGLILNNVTRGRQEAKRLAYLTIPAPNAASEGL